MSTNLWHRPMQWVRDMDRTKKKFISGTKIYKYLFYFIYRVCLNDEQAKLNKSVSGSASQSHAHVSKIKNYSLNTSTFTLGQHLLMDDNIKATKSKTTIPGLTNTIQNFLSQGKNL